MSAAAAERTTRRAKAPSAAPPSAADSAPITSDRRETARGGGAGSGRTRSTDSSFTSGLRETSAGKLSTGPAFDNDRRRGPSVAAHRCQASGCQAAEGCLPIGLHHWAQVPTASAAFRSWAVAAERIAGRALARAREGTSSSLLRSEAALVLDVAVRAHAAEATASIVPGQRPRCFERDSSVEVASSRGASVARPRGRGPRAQRYRNPMTGPQAGATCTEPSLRRSSWAMPRLPS
jgi:hypothetical protein